MRILFLLLLLFNVAFFAWFSRQQVALQPAQQAATDPGGIILLQERHAPSHGPAVIPSAPSAICYRAGPFEKAPSAEQYLAALTPRPERHEVTVEEGKTPNGYWVRWPQELVLAEARRIYRELRERGVRDVAITPAGKARYIISLGVFSQRGTMEERRNKIDALGYPVKVTERFKPLTRYWLLLEFGHTRDEAEATLQEMRHQFPDAGFEKIACS